LAVQPLPRAGRLRPRAPAGAAPGRRGAVGGRGAGRRLGLALRPGRL